MRRHFVTVKRRTCSSCSSNALLCRREFCATQGPMPGWWSACRPQNTPLSEASNTRHRPRFQLLLLAVGARRAFQHGYTPGAFPTKQHGMESVRCMMVKADDIHHWAQPQRASRDTGPPPLVKFALRRPAGVVRCSLSNARTRARHNQEAHPILRCIAGFARRERRENEKGGARRCHRR